MTLQLSEWISLPEPSQAAIKSLKKSGEMLDRLESIESRSPSPDKLLKLATIIKSNDTKKFDKLLNIKSYKRALFSLWNMSPEIIDQWPMTDKFLKNTLKNMTSDLLFQQILQTYMNNSEDQRLCLSVRFALREITKIPKKRIKYLSLINNPELIGADGPEKIAQRCINHGCSLVFEVENLNLKSHIGSKYFRIATAYIYLKKLSNKDEPITEELCAELSDPDLYNAYFQETRFLGHEIIRLLIDRYRDDTPPEYVVSLILAIAKDPRTSSLSSQYQKWWKVLGDKAVNTCKKWLSSIDIRLFLTIFEQFVDASGDEGMQRMFPARKRFMEGLLNSGYVTESKMFLGSKAHTYLTQHLNKEDIPYHGAYKGTITSVIYLKVGNIHFLEGSHSFKLRMGTQLPNKMDIMNHVFRTIHPEDCRHLFLMGTPKDERFEATHTSNGGWIYSAVEYLNKNGAKIDAALVMDEPLYKTYKRRYGA
jgi:hypothetical protein